jgi:hypothetical protein
MKKIILTAAFVVALSGFAAAQSTSTKPAAKQQEKATVKKGPASTENNGNTVLKHETSANAKSDSAVKLVLLPVDPVDTTAALPKVKNKDF